MIEVIRRLATRMAWFLGLFILAPPTSAEFGFDENTR